MLSVGTDRSKCLGDYVDPHLAGPSLFRRGEAEPSIGCVSTPEFGPAALARPSRLGCDLPLGNLDSRWLAGDHSGSCGQPPRTTGQLGSDASWGTPLLSDDQSDRQCHR
jgi:hypothetical protein